MITFQDNHLMRTWCFPEMCTVKTCSMETSIHKIQDITYCHDSSKSLSSVTSHRRNQACGGASYLRSKIFKQEPRRPPSACGRPLDAPRGWSTTTTTTPSSCVGSCASTATYWSTSTGPTIAAIVATATSTSTATVTTTSSSTSRRVLVWDSRWWSSGLAHWSTPQLACYHSRWGCFTPGALGTTQLAKWTKNQQTILKTDGIHMNVRFLYHVTLYVQA